MTTRELIQAAAAIAGGMVSPSFEKGQLSAGTGTMQEIARISVQLALLFEQESKQEKARTQWPA